MQETFGDLLVTSNLEKNEKSLPSPQQLKRKIILKHKKLPDGEDESSFLIPSPIMSGASNLDTDLRSTVKNGIMYLEDPVDKEWNAHFFVLTPDKLYYTDVYHSEEVLEIWVVMTTSKAISECRVVLLKSIIIITLIHKKKLGYILNFMIVYVA